MRQVLGVLGLVAMLASAHTATASTLGIDFTSPGTQPAPSVWNLGYAFSPTTDISVVALGTFDADQDGFATSQQVGLWDNSGTLLASTFVDNSDPLTGLWRFRSIGPVTLTAGLTYVVGSQGGEGYTWDPAGFTVGSEITFMNDRWIYLGTTQNDPLAFPTSSDALVGFFGGNFQYALDTPAPVPEPASLTLLGLGLAGMGARRWRQRKA